MWWKKCGTTSGKFRVCQKHFMVSDFDYVRGKKILKNIAIPCLYLEGPKVDICNIPKLRTSIIESVKENVELFTKLTKLKTHVNSLNGKITTCNTKIRRRKRASVGFQKELRKIETNSLSKNTLSKVFSDAQIGVLAGDDKVVWSNDDLAMAFSLRQLSSKRCYLYLKNTLNIPLPALSCVQRWAASK